MVDTRSGNPAVMVTEYVPIASAPVESDTSTVKLVVPVLVGVPNRYPEGSIVSPVGRLPEATDKEYGPIPPVTRRVAS